MGMLRFRARIIRGFTRIGFSHDWFLIPLAAIIGLLAGAVAMGFHWMVVTADHLFGRLADISQLGATALLVVMPALGGLAVGLIQVYISRAPAGHGIPDVIVAMSQRRGVIPARTGVIRAITASLTIGSGGSAGVEGPIVQIGSVIGSVTGQFLKVGKQHMNTLVGCGAAAGLASLFNAPIAGIIFVLEVVLRDFSLKTFKPIVVASVFGTAMAQTVADHGTLFNIPPAMRQYEFHLHQIGAYALLGCLCGLVGVAFTRGLHGAERVWKGFNLHPALKPAIGGALLGVLGVIYVIAFDRAVPGYGQPAFFANGYHVIESLFNPDSYRGLSAAPSPGEPYASATLVFLITIAAFKFIGTVLTLGSGGSGGIFAPSLFMGAALGGAFGMALQQLNWYPHMSPATYALAGMAGVLAGAVHCPLSAFLLVLEITQDYMLILPMMLVAIVATTVAQLLYRESIYSVALREHGINLAAMTDMLALRQITVAQVPLSPAVIVEPTDSAMKLVSLAENPAISDFVVADGAGNYLGLVVSEDLRTALLSQDALPLLVVRDLLRPDPPTVMPEETLDIVLDKFSRHEVSSLPVADADDPRRILGMITRTALMQRYQRVLAE